MQMGTCFGMNNETLASSFYIALRHYVWSKNHQVSFEWLRAVRTGRSNDIGAKGEVWHELPVHNIPLNNVNAGLIESTNLFANLGKIGWED
jgi:hypothetical protein